MLCLTSIKFMRIAYDILALAIGCYELIDKKKVAKVF